MFFAPHKTGRSLWLPAICSSAVNIAWSRNINLTNHCISPRKILFPTRFLWKTIKILHQTIKLLINMFQVACEIQLSLQHREKSCKEIFNSSKQAIKKLFTINYFKRISSKVHKRFNLSWCTRLNIYHSLNYFVHHFVLIFQKYKTGKVPGSPLKKFFF